MTRLDWLCYSHDTAARFARAATILFITVAPFIVLGLISPEVLAR